MQTNNSMMKKGEALGKKFKKANLAKCKPGTIIKLIRSEMSIGLSHAAVIAIAIQTYIKLVMEEK